MTEVLTLIDWSRRPFDPDGPPGPVTFVGEVSAHGGNWFIVPRVPGEILTAAKYNADRQAAVDNDTPLSIDDYSATIAEMQATTNPYPGGSVSQATSLAGELERIRYCIHGLNPSAPAWYAVPSLGLSVGSIEVNGNLTVHNQLNAQIIHAEGNISGAGFYADNNSGLWGARVDLTNQTLIHLGADDNIYIGSGLPTGKQIIFPNGAFRILSDGSLYLTSGLSMVKGQFIVWQERLGIGVDVSNTLNLGNNCAATWIFSPLKSVDTFTITKGKWLMADDIAMMAVAVADNSVYIGTNASVIRLTRPTYVTGELYTTGDVIIGAGGGGNLTARNTLKAWARATTNPAALLGGANVISVVSLGTGTLRFNLAPGAPGWAGAVATAEGPTHICSTTLLDSATVDVMLHDLTGALVNGAFCVAMF